MPDKLRDIGYGQIFAGYEKEGESDVILWVREAKNTDNVGETLRETSLRDYMAAHPEKAAEYTAYKAKCAEKANDILDAKEAMEKYFDELRPEISKWMAEQNNVSMGLALGMCFGMSIGMAIGSSMGNPTLGMTVGMSIGMCLGIALGSAKNRK
jgi:F0F1-type ATP synthase assembly protein I